MTKNLQFLFLCVVTIFISLGYTSVANAQSLVPLGPSDFDQASIGQAIYNTTAISASGTPYVVFANEAKGYKATVMKFNGSSWETVGIAGFSVGEAVNTTIAINSSGTPYVAYMDVANDNKATVMKFNGSSWETVGSAGFSAGQAGFTSIALSSDGTPFIVYLDVAKGYKATVMKFNGNSWETVGTAGFSAGEAYCTSIAINSNGTPYVVYTDVANNDKATVMKFNGSSWEIVGSAGFLAEQADYTSITINSDGTPYVVYTDLANDGKATVKKLNGSDWETVGIAGFSTGKAYYTSIVINSTGTPYVVYIDVANESKTTVKKFNGSSWVTVGSAGISAGYTDYPFIALNSNGTPYVVYSDGTNSLKATMMKFNGSIWEPVRSTGFSAGQAANTSIAINSSGTPYVVYMDGANSSKATVMKFNGSSWETVGSAGFSAGLANYTSIAINTNGTPYVVYVDVANSSKATVMKFNGSSWEIVGAAGFSAGQATFTSIAISSVGTPYVVYMDRAHSSKATVMKFNGSIWETVGSEGISAGQAAYPSIAISSDDTPYIAYRDIVNSSKATVMKLNGNSWETVGSAGFSAGQAAYTSIAINADGTPYVVYQDVAYNSKATVMKFNGSSWETVGNGGFSSGPALFTSIAINACGTPYVVYRDVGNGNKATLMKLNGNSWETVGREGFTAGSALYTSIAIHSDGTAYLSFTNFGAWAYKFETIYNPTYGGTIAADQNGCSSFDPAAFTSLTTPTGQSGTLEYKWQLSTTSSSKGFTDIANSNSATYDQGPVTVTTWYKRVARVGCMSDWTGAAESNVVTVLIPTWNGSTNTDWNTGTNWSTGIVPTASDNVTIANVTNKPVVNQAPGTPAVSSNLTIVPNAVLIVAAGKALTVRGTLTNNSTGGVVIQSDGVNGTGSLMIGSAAGTGSATAQRWMTTGAWHIVSSPVSGQTVADFLTTNANIATNLSGRGMMDYDPTTNVWKTFFTNETGGNMDTGKGFAIRVGSTDAAVTFSGSLQAGTLSASGLTEAKWNCIGNPYSSAIRIPHNASSTDNFLDVNAANFEPSYGAIYIWDNGDDKNGKWGYYTILNNTSPPFNNVQQGQAFMVNMKAGVTAVSFTPAMQNHSPALALKSSNIVWPTIKLQASVGAQKSSTLIAFNSNMTKGLDPSYDAGLLKGGSDLIVYSKLVEDNGIPFAIQALPDNDFSNMIIPIGLDFKTGGEVVFSSENMNLPLDCKVILEDMLTKTFTDLSRHTYKTTIAANSIITDRFRLKTASTTTGLDKEPVAAKLTAYANRNIEIIVKGQVSKNVVATLYDVHGRIVLVKILEEGNLNIIPTPNIKTGIYMLSVNDKGKSTGFKILVRE